MSFLNAFLLGLVQGFTEFLPVSSSGHLVLASHFLGVKDAGIVFEVFVHFGTLLAIVAVFYQDIGNLLRSFFSLFDRRVSWKSRYHSEADFRLMFYILVATIPAVIIGLLFKDRIEAAFEDAHFVGITLIITGILLGLTYFARKGDKELNLFNTIVMGIAQACAILPGISRSGSTISFGLFAGLRGEQAARFSFLLSIPAVLGATILKINDLAGLPVEGSYLLAMAVGTLAAFVSGYLAIRWMLSILRRGNLYWFAPYCLFLGLLAFLHF